MPRTQHLALALALPLLLLLMLMNPAQAAAQELQLSNLRPAGTVRVEVYADAESWRRGRNPVASRLVPVRNVTQRLRLEGLPEGRYAIRAMQAADSAGGCRWPPAVAMARRGYSRLPLARRAPPPFERAAVELREGQAVSLRLNLSDD
ncbi:DUF2141 domain-containing protein [Solimonas sp. K1W22B-7]|uniref:DUF2141 domain-containing protein n=1 Tax=Solimonas sp. K1W22B-7 TaxID=2303331 RepID=UPI0013C537E6|nr:DUF2141 domain-containing protein [Solimonas sp. K1W22B-7]